MLPTLNHAISGQRAGFWDYVYCCRYREQRLPVPSPARVSADSPPGRYALRGIAHNPLPPKPSAPSPYLRQLFFDIAVRGTLEIDNLVHADKQLSFHLGQSLLTLYFRNI